MQNTTSPTIQNLEAAFAGESMAHIKYMWFARQCRKVGDEATAKVFEDTAAQEMLHAFGHAELLFADETMTPAKCLQYAIDGETHEYTEMYPKFRHEAMIEGQHRRGGRDGRADRRIEGARGNVQERAGKGRQALRRAGQGGREAREALSGAKRRDCGLSETLSPEHTLAD
jgi:rubrerythrin